MKTRILKSNKVFSEFTPEGGMNLTCFAVGDTQLIAQATKDLFIERFAGLGSLIGPHFHHRPKEAILPVVQESYFPHIARIRAKGVLEPFSHGIARYVPWECQEVQGSLKAHLSSDMKVGDMTLESLEGFKFQMDLEVSTRQNGLFLDYKIDAEKPSVLGLHYYYTLVSGGRIQGDIEPVYSVEGVWKEIQKDFVDENGRLDFSVNQEADFGFIPKQNSEGWSEIFYVNELFTMKISFKVEGKERSWQLFRPKEGPYICLEPLTAKNPRAPVEKNSSLQVKIERL